VLTRGCGLRICREKCFDVCNSVTDQVELGAAAELDETGNASRSRVFNGQTVEPGDGSKMIPTVHEAQYQAW
jgi:hypothetical protein